MRGQDDRPVRLPGRPRTKRGALLTVGVSFALVAVVGLALVYFVIFPTSSPKPFTLTSSSVAGAPVSSTTRLAASWKVAAGSVAGYRVREKLGFLPAESDAVGRTSAITGEAQVTRSRGAITITAASFVVDVSKLKSDRSMRDQRIHTIGLQSDQYPKATFKLSSPVTFPASVLSGHVVRVSVTGVFKIHGTAKQQTVSLQTSVSSSAIQAVGSLTFPWSEFNMTAPSVGGFVNVGEKATMEFDLHLQPA